MPKEQFDIEFFPSGKGKATEPSRPEFPNGVSVNVCKPGVPFCESAIPYPGPECGYYKLTCKICKYTVAVTSVGRPDDPTDIKFPCEYKINKVKNN